MYVRVVVVQLLWLSGRALAAQARGVVGLTIGGYQPFHFPLFLPHNMQMFASYNAIVVLKLDTSFLDIYMLPRYVRIWWLQASNIPSGLTSTQYDTIPYHENKFPKELGLL